MIELFHGTNNRYAKDIEQNGIILSRGKRYTDFGQGFYTTPDFDFAMRCSKRKIVRRKGDEEAIIRLRLDDDAAEHLIKSFIEANVEWAQYIVSNRNSWNYVKELNIIEHNLEHTDAIVKGLVADGSVTEFAKSFAISKTLVSEADVEEIINPNYKLQYSFHTEESLSYIIEKPERIL